MIMTRTPLRVSLVGGGTDMESFFHQDFGAVVSLAIDKYIYVSINPKFDGKTRASYSELEIAEAPIYLRHDLIRAALQYFRVSGVEITSVSDIPGEGTGLGSSSAFLVGLVLALMKYTGRSTNCHPAVFADLAYDLEKNSCHHAVGKQDHYAAAYGGLHYYKFAQDDTVSIEPLPLGSQRRLENELMLFWTGKTRDANPILRDQSERLKNDPRIKTAGFKMRNIAVQLADELRHGNMDGIGAALNENWYLKRKLSHGVSNTEIDGLLEKALNAGATGGKLCGAGGGGFLALWVKPGYQRDVKNALRLRQIPWRLADQGCSMVYQD